MSAKRIAVEVLIDLRRRLDRLPSRSAERRDIAHQAAELYGVSESTLYRQIEKLYRPKALRRADHGVPRVLSKAQMMRYCEVIAALKIRTMNRKGRYISTVRAIEVLGGQGVETPDGLVKPEKGQLRKATVNRYLKQWGFDHRTLTYQTPAVRFQARHSNERWQFDLIPSDLKHVEEPPWHDLSKGRPILMLCSVVDDRSGVCYQEFRNVYGEDVEVALRFLFNAMSAKSDAEFSFRGIPAMLYMDNGPIARSRVFQSVMAYLGVQVQLHMPDSKAKHRHTAWAKGKVERAFRTVKEAHDVLYHLREPKDEAEANERLLAYLRTYNDHPHRSEPHSRMDDWQASLPAAGIREMCSWERFCTFAREPETRKIGIDARIQVDGTVYEVHADLAGEAVTLWWGLFDRELYVEHDEQRYGPYAPISGPIPLHRYRKFKKTKIEKRLERLEALADVLVLGEGEDDGRETLSLNESTANLPSQPSRDPDPFHEICFANGIKARLAIADYLSKPLALLTRAQKDWIDNLLEETLEKQQVMQRVRPYFRPTQGAEGSHVLDVMAHYGLTKDFRHAGFFDTEQHKRIFRQLRTAIPNGYLIAVSGIVGSSKTTTLRRLQEMLRKENKVIVSKSLSVAKNKTTLKTLICALFYDVSGDKDYKVATVGEKRERELQELIRSAKKTVALFIDEAHGLHHLTLTGLKRLMEVVQDGGGKLSIILAVHPKLHNDVKGPRMEEVGYRTLTVSLDSM